MSGQSSFTNTLWIVEGKAFLALTIVSLMVGAYLEFDYGSSTNLSGDGTFFMLGSGAAFLIGAMPVAIYGAPVYAYYLVEPKFPFALVVLASALPGVSWVLFATPERNVVLFVLAGPAIALILHLLMRVSDKPVERRP